MTPRATFAESSHHHLFVYVRGRLVLKSWLDDAGRKTRTVLFQVAPAQAIALPKR